MPHLKLSNKIIVSLIITLLQYIATHPRNQCHCFPIVRTTTTRKQSQLPLQSSTTTTTRTVVTNDGPNDKRKNNNNDNNINNYNNNNNNNPRRRGPLSMTIDELAIHMGGRGRALVAWDLYRIGVDPLVYFSTNTSANKAHLGSITSDNISSSSSSSLSSLITNLRVTSRQSQTLGQDALSRLSYLMERQQQQQQQQQRTITMTTNDSDNDTSSSTTTTIETSLARVSHISTSRDGTTKLLLSLASDGKEVETVIIPWKERGRSTLCISSQVGCRQGCTFCATGRMSLLRSLTSDEILVQLFHAIQISRQINMKNNNNNNNPLPPIDNIVFMGMGEPSDNAHAVNTAIDIITSRQGYGISPSRVTVSTVGSSPHCFNAFATTPCVLAWSVHAVRNDLRRRLVPTTREPMVELRRELVDVLKQRPKGLRKVMLEVTLIAGVNDNLREAEELADFVLGFFEKDFDDGVVVEGMDVMVNLIPYNDASSASGNSSSVMTGYKTPSKERVKAFQNVLWERGVSAPVRTTRGDDESAACGQLATTRRYRRGGGGRDEEQ